MTDLSRREALVIAGACACCAMHVTPATAADPKPAPRPKSLPIGKLADYAKPGFYDAFAKQKLLIARLDDRLVAISTSCTHKGCSVRLNADDKSALKCPCHKAAFDQTGTPTGGPAKTPLDRHALKQGADGTITVDLTKSFIESKWEDPAAFIPLSPAAAG